MERLKRVHGSYRRVIEVALECLEQGPTEPLDKMLTKFISTPKVCLLHRDVLGNLAAGRRPYVPGHVIETALSMMRGGPALSYRIEEILDAIVRACRACKFFDSIDYERDGDAHRLTVVHDQPLEYTEVFFSEPLMWVLNRKGLRAEIKTAGSYALAEIRAPTQTAINI